MTTTTTIEPTYAVQDYGANGWEDWQQFDTYKGALEFMDRMLAEYDNGRFRIVKRFETVMTEAFTNDVTER